MRLAMTTLAVLLASALAGAAEGDAADVMQGDKTLVAWVAPANLTQRNVGVLTQDNMAGSFDGIIFGELFEKKWMAGSDWFRRTDRDQKGSPVETADAKTFVQIAIAYKGKQVTIYRNGKQYARYATKGDPMAFGVGGAVVIGRHNADPRARYFAGQVDDARIYDVALSAKQVAALRPDAPSDPKPWAWWTFDKAAPKDRMGRFDTEVTGSARIEGGKLLLDGKDDSIFAVRAGTGGGPLKAPPAPKEFANVFSVGYGTADLFPKDPAAFEKLLLNLKGAGYNTVHCVYSDARLELFRKHGMKIMIDVLAWKEGAETDIRRPRQQAKVRAICKKVRDDDAVWGYNLWNERMDKFSPGGIGACNRLLYLLRKWDTTHPVWVGTYLNYFSGSLTTNPGCYGYYDYHWQRGMKWHFMLLNGWKPLVEKQDAYLGRWILRTDYNKCMYTLNTSIAYGLKTCIWFICGPWHPARPEWNDKHFLCRIGRDMHRLWPELGKIRRPLEVYSTPTTKAPGNQDKKKSIPAGRAIPDDFWMQVKSGEALLGHFKYDSERDAIYIANHNAVAAQKMVMEFKGKTLKVEMFDRKTGKYVELKPSGRTVTFDLSPSGGELLRISGREKRHPPQAASRPAASDKKNDPRIGYFMDVAIGAEFGDKAQVIKKWHQPIKFKISGSPTKQDLETLKALTAELKQLSSNIKIQASQAEKDHNCVIHFIPKKKFRDVTKNAQSNCNGFVTFWWKGQYAISKAVVLIASDIRQDVRSCVIREEVTQSLGIARDSNKYRDSVFHTQTDVPSYSEMDKFVIATLYRNDIKAGMALATVKKILKIPATTKTIESNAAPTESTAP